MVKVTIDRDACIACGACSALCPDVFGVSEEDGKSIVVEKFRVGGNPSEGEVPDDLKDCAKSAAESCPVEAIKVE